MAAAQYGQQSTTMNLEMSSALARQQSSEQSNQYLTNLLKGVGKVGDTDWSSVIAGLSKKGGTKSAGGLNLTGGRDYGITPGQTASSPNDANNPLYPDPYGPDQTELDDLINLLKGN